MKDLADYVCIYTLLFADCDFSLIFLVIFSLDDSFEYSRKAREDGVNPGKEATRKEPTGRFSSNLTKSASSRLQ